MATFKRSTGSLAEGGSAVMLTATVATVVIGLTVANTGSTIGHGTVKLGARSLRSAAEVPIGGVLPWGGEGKLVLLPGDVLSVTIESTSADYTLSYMET